MTLTSRQMRPTATAVRRWRLTRAPEKPNTAYDITVSVSADAGGRIVGWMIARDRSTSQDDSAVGLCGIEHHRRSEGLIVRAMTAAGRRNQAGMAISLLSRAADVR